MLELDDIQGVGVSGYGMPYARFLFLRIHTPEAGRQWIKHIIGRVTTARPWTEPPRSCVNTGFTHSGLKALGLAQASLDTFEKEFQEGIARRAEILGDTGQSSPQNWQDGLGTDELHAMLLLFAQDATALEEESQRQRDLLQTGTGVEELSAQDAAALPTGREHFGYRDGITHVLIEGGEKQPLPGQTLIKAGEFVLGYPDESGNMPPQPQPDVLGRNGSFLVYRKLYQDVAGWRRFIRQEADKLSLEPELLSAKLMGRWRSGAPLMLAPKTDDPLLANDPQRNGDFGYAADERGLVCPLGAHVRRANPRDTLNPWEQNRHLLMRRGLPYGPLLEESSPDDGEDRGVAGVFVNASISRQFEFVQQTWLNDRKFHDLPNDKDPIAGDHDGTCDMTIPAKPFLKRIRGLPRFTTVKGGGYFFAPGISALKFLADEAAT